MKDEKKEKTDLIEVDIPVKDKDFGMHPAELEDEINQEPVREEPVREKDCKVQVKGLPEPIEEQQEESKPKMITIKDAEEKKKPVVLNCPFGSLDCTKCRLFVHFAGVKEGRTCSVIRIAHRMPL